MKLPFEFAPKFLLRVGLPGLILALATAPLVFACVHASRMTADGLLVVALGTVFWGWMVSLADMPIYMLYEGRRFWPAALFKFWLKHQQKRLDAIMVDAGRGDREREIEKLDFPLDRDGEPQVRYPTRLGNLITAYETYSRVNYGIDAIFWWPRLWVLLDKDLREEIDNQQALADSSLYVSFTFWVSAALSVCYAIANGVLHSRLGSVPSPGGCLLLAIGCAGAAYGIYRTSLPAHAQFGTLFKAVFDEHRHKLAIDELVKRIATLSGDPEALQRSEGARYRMVALYLRWHRIRPPGEARNYTPEGWKTELKRRQLAAPASSEDGDGLPLAAETMTSGNAQAGNRDMADAISQPPPMT